MEALSLHPQLPCVLFIDDEVSNRQAFRTAFRREFDVEVAGSLQEAWEVLIRRHVHVVIADQRMPGTHGSEVLGLVRERYPAIRRMLITGYSDIQAVIEAVNKGGVSHYIHKPWDHDQVVQAVGEAFSDLRREEERSAFTEQLLEANRALEFALRQRLLS